MTFPDSNGSTKDVKTQHVVEVNFSVVLVKIKFILLHYTELLCKQLIRHKFLKDEFSEAARSNQQDDEKLGQKDNQRSGTELS